MQSNEELRTFAGAARFPCLLKPRQHQEWESLPLGNPLHGKKVVSGNTLEDLLTLYGYTEGFHRGVVAQEFVPGGDDTKYCYLSVYGKNATRLGHCVVREFRAYPLVFGSASIVEPVVDEEIAEICDNFLQKISYEGLCEIEVKRDPRDGKIFLIEVNPRFSGTGDCARFTGIDTGWLHYLDLIGQPVHPVKPTRFGFRHITLQRDLPSFPKYMGEKLLTFVGWIKSYTPPVVFWDMDWTDPLVTIKNLYRSVRGCVGNLLRYWRLR